MRLARDLRTPPSILRGRIRATRWLYDDPVHPDRVTGTITEPLWLRTDRALMLALTQYEAGLCAGCGQPKDRAWHPDNEGWYEPRHYVCHGCAAIRDDPEKATYTVAVDERDYHQDPLPDGASYVVPYPVSSDAHPAGPDDPLGDPTGDDNP